MNKHRSLADLYVRGTELTLDDGVGYFTVWLQKLNPVEINKAAKKADAARSRVLVALRDKEGEEYTGLLGDVLALENSEKLDVLVGAERTRITPMVENEISLLERWTEGYLNGLRESWNDGLEKTFVDDPDDEEAKRVFGELSAFIEQVSKKVQSDLQDYRSSMELLPPKDLDDAVLRLHMKNMGDVAWLQEFQRCEIWLGTRDVEDHTKPLFANRSDVDVLQGTTLAKFTEAFRDLTVDPVEGKDSAGNPPSSASSEVSETVGTEPSSGPEGATA